MPTRPSPSLITIALLIGITAMVAWLGLWQGNDGNGWKQTIRSDARGYYGYLQALFIRHDLGHEPFDPTYVKHTPTGTLNKYFCGTSLMMMPWFAVGHALATMDPDSPQDGTSAYEQKAIGVGAWVYLLIGLLALRAVMRTWGLNEALTAWLLAAIVLGTPLVQYTAIQPGWSHIYSFCAICCWLYCVLRYSETTDARWLVCAGALLGLIVIIRPVNAMVLIATPLVAKVSLRDLLYRLWRQRLGLLLGMVACSAVILIQPLLWYLQTGAFYQYGYQGEGFHWSKPEVFKVLFGFRRGLFLWTPLMLLPALGAVLLWWTDRRRALLALVYWGVSTYVISSWWIWYYGGGFASRVYIDHYPILFLPLVILAPFIQRHGRLIQVFLVGCIALNLFQLWQFQNGFLHAECMDKDKYLYSFLRTDEGHRHRLGGNYQAAPYHPNGMTLILEETCGMDDSCTYWTGGRRIQWEGAHSPSSVLLFDAHNTFGITFSAGTDVLPTGRALFLEIGLQRFQATYEASRYALGVTEVLNNADTAYFYEPFPIDPLPGKPGEWQQLEYRVPVPPLSDGDRLRFYLWNKGGRSQFLVDDVFMRVSAVNPY